MTSTRSPFLTFDDFLSPAQCEKLLRKLSISSPAYAEDGRVLKYEHLIKEDDDAALLKGLIQERVGEIENRYDATVTGMEAPVFQQYFEDPKNPCELHGCESSKFLRKKWVKIKDIDLVGFIWLKDFQSGVPLDPRIETYGGKLEFPAYNFSLIPQRGTLILYPATPHFITAISPVLVGSLEQIKITIKLKDIDGKGTWIYQPSKFPGTYQEWFAEG